MNILVTGANGQLGNEMRCIAATSLNNYIFTDVALTQPPLEFSSVWQFVFHCVYAV